MIATVMAAKSAWKIATRAGGRVAAGSSAMMLPRPG
jgi:hypothetical protein